MVITQFEQLSTE